MSFAVGDHVAILQTYGVGPNVGYITEIKVARPYPYYVSEDKAGHKLIGPFSAQDLRKKRTPVGDHDDKVKGKR